MDYFDEAPEWEPLSDGEYSVDIPETLKKGDFVFKVETTDKDANDKIT